MFILFVLLAATWFIVEIKATLFWLYLWQLKDYHVGRFLDHFQTRKGQKIFLNFVWPIKLSLLVLFLLFGQAYIYLAIVLFLIYLIQGALFLRGFIGGLAKRPVKTAKIAILAGISFLIIILFLILVPRVLEPWQPVLFLSFDILTPLIISLVVLFLQPLFVLARNNILYQAKNKLDKIKSLSGVKIIAITGSYGKTTTKEFLSTILSKSFEVLATKNHQNSEAGIASCILRDLKLNHQIFIAEIGAYNKGKVREVCSMLGPQIGVVTGVNEQHLSLFGSLKNLLSAEGGGELADFLLEEGILFVNGDNKYCLDLYKKFNGNKKIYSLDNKTINPDIWSEDVEISENNISFMAVDSLSAGVEETAYFKVNVLGKQNVQNLLGAILVARELGMSLEKISEACKNILPQQAGMVLKSSKNGIKIIDSSYSANPSGVIADLEYLSIFKGRKIAVMPCLIELGEKSCEVHEKIGKKMGEICDLAIITSEDKFKEIEEGFNMTKKSNAQCILCLPDGRQATEDVHSLIASFCKSGDAVLLEGRVPQKLIEFLT